MKHITQKELDKMISDHKHWLDKDCYGWEDMRLDLSYTDCSWLSMSGAVMVGANMCNADMRGADMCYANMRYADMRNANMHNAVMRGADMRDAKNVPFIPLACPEKGSFTGFKKCRGLIVELEIPADAKRSSATSFKCRCDKARVLSITNLDGSDSGVNEVISDYDKKFVYRIGETVTVDNFDEDRWNECAPGIHFFVNRQNAVEY